MTKDEALKLALRSLKELAPDDSDYAPALQGQRKRQENAITAIKQALAAPVQEPVGWISNKDFEPIRIRIMQEAYELADNNDPEGYNAIKVMCGDVQKMLSPQRTWVGTVDCIGLALDLEAQAKRVESQTVQRTMLAAANGLRIIDKESKT